MMYISTVLEKNVTLLILIQIHNIYHLHLWLIIQRPKKEKEFDHINMFQILQLFFFSLHYLLVFLISDNVCGDCCVFTSLFVYKSVGTEHRKVRSPSST
jgi:hypothetical protein